MQIAKLMEQQLPSGYAMSCKAKKLNTIIVHGAILHQTAHHCCLECKHECCAWL
jgi:hypothetical protein